MVKILLENVTKEFKGIKAVDSINLEVQEGEFLSLLGPSGCGKTTTLRLVAGLESPTRGKIFFNDVDVTLLPPAKRNVAMVFQSYALYPHMTVFENMAFPLEVRGVPKEEKTKRVREVAEFLKIDRLLDRKPIQLSGGQRQRVALGRAIVRNPSAFLMDEPLSNLDAKLRTIMRADLKKLQEKLGVTTVYVTHDQVEAMTMSRRIAVMNEGVIQQLGPPNELYSLPSNVWVAGFIGSPPMNLVECTLVERDADKFLDAGEFTIPLNKDLADHVSKAAKGPELTLGLKPESISISKKRSHGSVKGTVHTVEPVGEYVIVNVSIGDHLIKVKAPPEFAASSDEEVYVVFDEKAMYIYERGGRLLT